MCSGKLHTYGMLWGVDRLIGYQTMIPLGSNPARDYSSVAMEAINRGLRAFDRQSIKDLRQGLYHLSKAIYHGLNPVRDFRLVAMGSTNRGLRAFDRQSIKDLRQGLYHLSKAIYHGLNPVRDFRLVAMGSTNRGLRAFDRQSIKDLLQGLYHLSKAIHHGLNPVRDFRLVTMEAINRGLRAFDRQSIKDLLQGLYHLSKAIHHGLNPVRDFRLVAMGSTNRGLRAFDRQSIKDLRQGLYHLSKAIHHGLNPVRDFRLVAMGSTNRGLRAFDRQSIKDLRQGLYHLSKAIHHGLNPVRDFRLVAMEAINRGLRAFDRQSIKDLLQGLYHLSKAIHHGLNPVRDFRLVAMSSAERFLHAVGMQLKQPISKRRGKWLLFSQTCLLIGLLFSTIASFSQSEQAIEDMISNLEIDGQIDLSSFTEQLEIYRQNPLDINRATREELSILPGMDDLKINRLINYRKEFGDFLSIYELQAVPGLRIHEIRTWLPFIIIKTGKEKDINPDQKHPSGPGIKELFREIESEIIHRQSWIVESQKGYSAPDTTFQEIEDQDGNIIGMDTALNQRYLGSKFRNYTRYRARYRKNFSAAITGEKDPGEVFLWNPAQGQLGYDFLSGHLSIGNYGNLKRLVVGDYNLQFGQGMILSRGIGFGKGAEVIRSLKMPEKGILPYASVNENQFMRGIASTVAWGDFYFTGFYSRLALDGTLPETDSLSDSHAATSLKISGLHRTANERLFRKNLKESVIGGRATYRSPTLRVGITALAQRYGIPVEKPINDYNQFDFRGDRNHLASVDFDWVFQNFNFFGEFGRSQSGGTGAIIGFMSSLAPQVDLSFLYRRFSRDFHSNRGYVFAERPTAVQNETGVYLGLKITPGSRWTLSGYVDQFYFPWNRFRASFPSKGWEYLVQVEYKPRRGTQVYLRYRQDSKQINADEFPSGQQLEYLVLGQKRQLRLHFQTKVHRDISYRTRLEFASYNQAGEETQKGILFFQDLSWKLGFKYKITGRFAIFDAPEYDARIYAYENDVLGFASIPPYYRTGSRFYLIFNWKPMKKLEFWARIAQTHLFKNESFGSGLEEISGPQKTEIKLQGRIKF
jgi:hypothetical protein